MIGAAPRTVRRALVLLCTVVAFSDTGCRGERPADVLVFGRGSDSVGLDPALENDGESFKVCDNIFENLVTYEEASTAVRPQLAHSWDVSDDQLLWTFHLRRGVRFHDGTPFDAQAMLFSLGRQFFDDHPFHDVEGAFKYWKDMDMDDIVADMYASDDSTFVIHLSHPNVSFLATLGMNFCAAVSPAALRKYGEDFFKNPVGTGPFRFVEWRRGERIVLARNDDYWGAPPELRLLIFKPIRDASVRYFELRTGSIQGLDNISPEFIDAIREDPDLELLTQPGMNVGYLAMNMDKPPFDDRRVRLAVNHAVNKRSLVDNFYSGLAVPAVNPLPPTMWSYNDDIEPYAFDRQRAVELLREAGFENGFDTELWTMPAPRPYMPQPRKIAVALQADLAAVGIRADIVQWEWGHLSQQGLRGRAPHVSAGMDRRQWRPGQFPVCPSRFDSRGEAGSECRLLPQFAASPAARRSAAHGR